MLGRGTCSTLEFLSGVGFFFDDFARILVQREHWEHVLNVYFFWAISKSDQGSSTSSSRRLWL